MCFLIFPKQDRDPAQKPTEVMCVHSYVNAEKCGQQVGGERLKLVKLQHAVPKGECNKIVRRI